MPDPFEALRSPPAQAEPDPAFATRLRARVERALTLPEGVIVSQTTLEPEHAPAAAATGTTGGRPAGASGVIPYLIVADTRRAMQWYVDVLGARRRGEPMLMPDGRVGHAELEIGTSLLFMADPSPESHVAAPVEGADATVSLVVEVGDVDATVERALEAGGTLERAPAEHPYGRNAVVRDPFHHRWLVSSLSAEPAAPEAHGDDERTREGDIGYTSLWVPDVERAATFFGAVLGWHYAPGSGPAGRQVAGVTPHHGMWGDQERSSLFLCFAVHDVDEAIERVQDAGGEAEAPTDEPYGRVAGCVDDQGTHFALYTPPGGDLGPRIAAHGSHHGDLAYVTMEVVDSGRARAFYGTVLGWRFVPGRVEDGWQLEDIRPGVGLRGGVEQATSVPMYRVDDIADAVTRVRAAGGTATEPEARPYGLEATCTDDQGTRFYLGQL